MLLSCDVVLYLINLFNMLFGLSTIIYFRYRYLASGSSFYSISFEYLLGPTTIREIVKSTCTEIWNIMQPIYMAEKSEEDWINIANQFFRRTNFPNVIGAIDGKHIRIIQPDNSGSQFFNYKFFSIILMAWVDADYKFVYVDIGVNGAASDSSVFESHIWVIG